MIYIVLAVLGLALGSFVNALVWRLYEQGRAHRSKGKGKKPIQSSLPLNLSIMRGRSMCVHCHHQLAWMDLMPVVSWIWLRGKCRYCHKSISWQYPLIEVLTAALCIFSYIYWPYGFEAAGIIRFATWLVMVTGFMALIIYDLRWMLLPNRIVYPLLAVAGLQALVLVVVSGQGALNVVGEAVWGIVCGGGVFYILFQASRGKWIGGGDVKLGFLLGLLVGGPVKSLLLLFVASSLGTLLVIPLLFFGRLSRKSRIPFGPLLIVAAIVVYLFGGQIIDWYTGLVMLEY